jgi:hypothetical protein
MDLSSQQQYIQRATNAKLNVAGTTSLETIYTAPAGGDFDFAIIESLLVSDDGNQQTNIDIVVVNGGTTHYLFKQHNITAHATDEMLTRSLILTAGEILKIQVSHANINVLASVVEYAKGD